MKNFNIIIATLLLAVLCSCEKDVDYSGPTIKSMLVINARLVVGEEVKCHLSNSKPITSPNGMDNIDDAEIKLFVNNQLKATLVSAGEGEYVTNTIVEEGLEYKLIATRKGYSDVSAKFIMPKAPKAEIEKITPVQYIYYPRSSYDINNLKFNITLEDPEEENYYRIKVLVRYNQTYSVYEEDGSGNLKYMGERDTSYWGETYFESNDPLIKLNSEEIGDEPENSYRVFSDETFNGELYNISLEADFSFHRREAFTRDSIPLVLKVQVQSIDKGLYLYYKSKVAQYWYGESPFSEPVQLYTNVENGAGILGGVANKDLLMKTEHIELGEPELP